MPRLAIVLASNRPGRVGLPVAQWFTSVAEEHSGFDIDFVDLAEVDLPFMDEPNHPRLQDYQHEHTQAWSQRMSAVDALAIVTPEYNFGMPAILKNALDYLNLEWAYKPVGFVSYGGISAGTRGVQMSKQVVTTLRMIPVQEAVAIPFVHGFLDDDDRIQPNQVMSNAAEALLDELLKVTEATASMRESSRG